ncbi:MAG: hypothetical protein ACREL5_02545 [Gemmatimonadales bacterium]
MSHRDIGHRATRGIAPWLIAVALVGAPGTGLRAQGIVDSASTDNLPPGKGQLSLSNLRLQLSYNSLQVVFIPLDERVLRLLTGDSYRALEATIASYRHQIDSVTSFTGVTQPGIALVSFLALAPNVRFDPQLVTLVFHGQQVRPIGWVAISANFSNQQLQVRDQVQAILVYARDIPVREGFTLSYVTAANDDWQNRLPRFDAERARILGSIHGRPDTTGGGH